MVNYTDDRRLYAGSIIVKPFGHSIQDEGLQCGGVCRVSLAVTRSQRITSRKAESLLPIYSAHHLGDLESFRYPTLYDHLKELPSNMSIESVGLAVGIIGLVPMFKSTVECFEYVELSRSFGASYTTAQLKLANTQLRLLRWGTSVGLDTAADAVSLERHLSPDLDVTGAQETLGMIRYHFHSAQRIADQYKETKSRENPDDISLTAYNSRTDLAPVPAQLQSKIQELILKYEKRSSFRQRAKWVLFQEKQFTKLMENIASLLADLDDLYPAAQQIQRSLCEQEVAAFDDTELIGLMKSIAEAQDKLMAEVIAKRHPEASTKYIGYFGYSTNYGVQSGLNHGTITFGK
jgi:hypothetical protein